MELGFSREQLLVAFNIALKSSIQDVRILKERGLRISLGEFPSEEKEFNEAMALLEPISSDELLPIVFTALLKVIKTNNDRIAKQLEPYLPIRSTVKEEK